MTKPDTIEQGVLTAPAAVQDRPAPKAAREQTSPATAQAIQSAPSPSSILTCGEPREVDCDFVIPVFNEQAELGSSIMLLMNQLREVSLHAKSFTWQIVIADNASSDKT